MASLFGSLGGSAASAAGGGVAAAAAKSGLFKPTALFKGAANAAVGQAQKSAKERVAAVVGGQGGKIEWTVYNWPSRSELVSLIHFDLVELKEKRDAGVYGMILGLYRWWGATLALCGLNFVDSCILTGVAAPAFSGVNVLFSLIWTIVWAAVGMGMVYQAYKGYAEPSIKAKIIAKVLVCVLYILAITHMTGHFGNVNGLAGERERELGLGGRRGARSRSTLIFATHTHRRHPHTDTRPNANTLLSLVCPPSPLSSSPSSSAGLAGTRFQEARAEGASDGGVKYWEAVTVVESLLWLGNLVWLSWAALRIFKGPSSANEAEQLPK
jgi:hypothetical protein